MGRIERVKVKIGQIEKLLVEVKNELETIAKESLPQSKKVPKKESILSEEDMRIEFEKLYEEFKVKNIESIKDFIKSRSKRYLKYFSKANNLPLDTTKVSKDEIIDEVMKWLAQREAITKKAT